MPDIFISFERENLIYVIELKRPSVKINRQIMDEVEDKYVRALTEINGRLEKDKQKKISALVISSEKTQDVVSRGDLGEYGLRLCHELGKAVLMKQEKDTDKR
ncbi:hypothetical protein [Helicobacter cetorum]|uniref:Uncharacterized protein n=1 Tax=Helicobacter cetorum (strain ATCC BAA-540 / CCUG 52418 / MIT 99-5656) TaxID=1163745 RepID=I0EUG0_HELCM|nr:hypothetical protein [Helicobacter cetorum]AFI06579.1 hypothetical protein HCD_07975 [Helicobacter cetorum MIT 99-5656]